MSRAIAVIPARWGSTRFPGKPLAKIQNLEMIAWVIRGAKTSRQIAEVIVATDDKRIADVAEREGVRAVMTDSDLPSGSDRIWQAIQKENCEIVLNVQGDEPLITGTVIDALLKPMLADSNLEMATLAQILTAEDLASENSIKVLTNQVSEAVYFSRFPIPFSRSGRPTSSAPVEGVWKHIGMYAYRKEFLQKYCEQGPVFMELAESLEQLRALYLGARLKVVITKEKSWGVDSPEDIAKIEKILGASR